MRETKEQRRTQRHRVAKTDGNRIRDSRTRPESFWNMSMIELFSAIEGFKEFNTDQSKKPLSKDELMDLMERYPD